MGYKIQYDPGNNKKYPTAMPLHRNKTRLYLVGGVIIAGVLALIIRHQSSVLNWLLPGDFSATSAAFEGLIVDVRSGIPAGQAITAFCKEIIEYAAK